MSIDYPRIYLAIDNCFASKRWTRPMEWMQLISELGFKYIEASADTECDPMYMGEDYMADWVKDVKRAEKATGAKVVNLYSGHGTYTTLGLAHNDERIRKRFLENWLMPMAKTAEELGAGLGFFCHAFNDSTLQNEVEYENSKRRLYENLAELGSYASNNLQGYIGVEQMYTPHQIPWTIKGAKELIKEVYKQSGHPFYITIDTGHQSGQHKFTKPTTSQLLEMIRNCRKDNQPSTKWLGPLAAHNELRNIISAENTSNEEHEVERLKSILDDYPHLFADEIDGDTYAWLEELAGYSPIIHLQQTDGKTSGHWPFTKEFNCKGIIEGDKVLKSIAKAYTNGSATGFPSKVESIYLTVEVFSATASLNEENKKRLKETLTYWRQFVPTDGMRLDDILENMNAY